MKVLTLSSVFPNPCDPGFGLFVRSRMEEVAAYTDLKVVAPIPVIDYSGPWNWFERMRIPSRRQDGPLDVRHPRWIYPPGGRAWNGALMYRQLKGPLSRLRKEFPFELIDAHFGFPEGIAAGMHAEAMGVPFVVTLRGNETKHAESPAKREAMTRALRAASRVISVSESLRRFAISLGVSPDRVKTIPNGIDNARYYPRDRAESRRKHGIDPGAKVVLSVGYLIERKGHHRTAQAVHDIESNGITAQLLIAGAPGREGKFEQQIHETVSRLGLESRVRFLGQVPSSILPELMSAADVLCLATTREGWPNVVHEAMGCGTPVVATDVGGIPEMIASDAYGYVVQAGNPEALRDALKKALERTWDREAIAAWAAARSWKRVAAEVWQEFQLAAEPVAERRAGR